MSNITGQSNSEAEAEERTQQMKRAIRKLHTAISHAEEAIRVLSDAPELASDYNTSIKQAIDALTSCLGRLEKFKETHDKEAAWRADQDKWNRVYGPLVNVLADSKPKSTSGGKITHVVRDIETGWVLYRCTSAEEAAAAATEVNQLAFKGETRAVSEALSSHARRETGAIP